MRFLLYPKLYPPSTAPQLSCQSDIAVVSGCAADYDGWLLVGVA